MKVLSIKELAGVLKATFIETGRAETECTGIGTDSRTIKTGDCFFAISGENFDGHNYLADAFAKGAACAVVEKDIETQDFAGKSVLRVRDTVKALGLLAGWYRWLAGFKVVGITGSAGKTTTKQITYHVLSRFFRVHCSPRSFNNQIGVPLTLLGAEPEVDVVVTELGSNHPGEISYLTRIARPDVAVVTNVHPAHLEGFGDIQNIVREKLSIVEGLESGGVLIINGDFSLLVDACRAGGLRFLTFGKSEGSDYRISDIYSDGHTGRFEIDGVEVNLPLAGSGNVENAAAAWAVCNRFGIGVADFARAIQTLPGISMRSELLRLGTLTVLNDCYNANPASMKNALEILAAIEPTGERRRIFICGEMAELGEHAERLHAELGKSIAVAKVELLLAVGPLAKIAADAAKVSAGSGLQVKYFEDTVSACNKLHEF
ncbi:MAG: UDP-N-acetylmuramoyl-tripeptide--D-alanyl-D-alanine ligase, partial [Sedimentisphaerales bacterium]|nr:UDP-N-acetylmuramoyl-tripeptide--D-alanyl-D-alanine ligase [Sedimentisphaerales bacterium]